MTSRILNEVFSECHVPEMHRFKGIPRAKIDTGLDSDLHNFKLAE